MSDSQLSRDSQPGERAAGGISAVLLCPSVPCGLGVECLPMKKITGNITIPADCDVWPHELKTAQALAAAGHDVRFVRKSDQPNVRTADLVMDGEVWEMKAQRLATVERNLRRALGQSRNIIFDSRRMKGVPDAAVERELRKWGHELEAVRRLIMVNRRAEAIDIP